MNCLSPLRIKNRCSHFDGYKPLYLTVPCGRCENCLQNKRRDWFIRSYYEYLKSDTTTFFYTLTYNNEHLPSVCGVPCFSKRNIQLFLKRLRFNLDKCGVKLRYMVTSEYGELRHRPHYHALFFLDKKEFNPIRFYRIVESAWCFGFVKYGDNFGVVNSSKGIQYVTKYVTKDFANIDDYFAPLATAVFHRYNRLLDYLRYRYSYKLHASLHIDYVEHRCYVRRWSDCMDVERDEMLDLGEKLCNKFKRMIDSRLPFHMQSQRLGDNIKNVVMHDNVIDSFIYMYSVNNLQKFSLPRYFKRLFYYDVVENELDGKCNKFVLNDLGKRHYLDELDKSIDNKSLSIHKILCNYHKYVDADVVKEINERLNLDFNQSSLLHYLSNFDLNVRQLAIYSVCFRDRICPFKYDEILLTDSLVEDNYYDYVRWSCYAVSEVDYGKIYELYCERDKVDFFGLLLWNSHPYFFIYEVNLSILDILASHMERYVSYCKTENEKDARLLRELINNNYCLTF